MLGWAGLEYSLVRSMDQEDGPVIAVITVIPVIAVITVITGINVITVIIGINFITVILVITGIAVIIYSSTSVRSVEQEDGPVAPWPGESAGQ